MSAPYGPIALVSPRYAPAAGGVEKHVEALARRFVQRGLAVEVLASDPTGALPAVEERDGVTVRRFPTVGGDGTFFVSPGLARWLLRHGDRFGVIHAHSYHTPLALGAALAARRHGVPLVLTPHYHGTGHSPLRRLLHWPYRPCGQWLIHQARAIICVSAVEEQLVQRHFGAELPTLVLPNGVETAGLLAAQPLPTDRVVLLAVGRLEAYKGVDRLIAALPHLPDDHEAVVIGAGPDRARLAALAARLGVAGRVRLLGQVAQADLWAWYRTAAVFVSMSQHEAFGITLLEGAVAGAQVVASDIAAHREVGGYLPAGRLTLVERDGPPQQLADRLRLAARQPRGAYSNRWLLPTWEAAVEGALACYRLAGYGALAQRPREVSV